MTLPPASVLELALAGSSSALAAIATTLALCARGLARRDRAALRLARACERAAIDAGRALAAAARTSAHTVRDELARAAREAVPCVDGVLIFDEDAGELHCSATFGERFRYFGAVRARLDDDAFAPARALARGERVTSAAPGLRTFHPADAAAIAVPLSLEPGRRSVVLFAATSALDARESERLAALADLAGPAYVLAIDRERDRRDAEFDGLTGLLTPRAFRRRLHALAERTRYDTAGVALLFADTDRFKDWNDTYGHASGDALLRELAAALRAEAGPLDLAARNGGDEFCLVLAGVEKARAIERAERLRARIAALELSALRPAAAREAVRITASIGVAAMPADAASAADLLERADEAMYHCKSTGRDGVAYFAVDGTLRRAG